MSQATNYRQEFRLYARDIDGKVIKVNDHLMDAKRYLIMSGLVVMQSMPVNGPRIDPARRDYRESR